MKKGLVFVSVSEKGAKSIVSTERDIAKARAFLAAFSSEEVGDGMFLDCCCEKGDHCPLWEVELAYVGKCIRVPKCLLKVLKARCGKLIAYLERFRF